MNELFYQVFSLLEDNAVKPHEVDRFIDVSIKVHNLIMDYLKLVEK